MTHSHESRVRLDQGAERLLESLTGTIVQEAHRAAVHRSDPSAEISSMDIVRTLTSKHEQRRRRDRNIFAAQLLGTALALSGTIIVSSGGLLAAGDKQDVASQAFPLFVTVLLILLVVMMAALIIFSVGDISDGFRIRLSRASRLKDEQALLEAWHNFEDGMRRSVELIEHGRERLDLATVIDQFARLHGIAPGDIKKVLKVRNAVAHRTSRVSSKELRASLDELRKLRELLALSNNMG